MLNKMSDRLKEVKPSGIRKFFGIVQSRKDVISLGVGEPDFPTPWNIVEAAYYSMEAGKTHYTSNMGLLELREEIAEYLKKFKVDYSAEEIMITVGGSEGIDLALRSTLNPGDEIVVPIPIYVPYEPLSALTGAKVVTIDTAKTGLKLTAESLKASITEKTKAVVLCYPNNPTGITMSSKELREIADVIKEAGIWCITDEIYAELTYEEEHYSIAEFEDIKDQVIYLSGFSKSFAMTGWRIGYLAAKKEIIDQIIKIHQYTTLCAPVMGQYGAIDGLRHSMKDVANMKESYSRRRRVIYDGLSEMGFEIIEPKGAMYVFPNVKKFGMSGEEFAIELLEAKNVAVVPGAAFGEEFGDYIRCSYATSLSEIKEALKRIGEFLEERKEI